MARALDRREATTRSIDLDGPIAYEEWPGPSDRTFVLVHGLGGAHLNWRLVGPGLADHGRVLAPDLPGFGLSPRAGRRSTISANLRLLSRFVAQLGSGEIVLAGNSMGGGLALLQAAHEPDGVAGVVATGAIHPWSWSRPDRRTRETRAAYPSSIVLGGFAMYRAPAVGPIAVRARTRGMSPERAVDLAFRLCTVDASRIPPDIVAEHVAMVERQLSAPDSTSSFVEAARSLLVYIERPETAHRVLDAIRAPVLVVHGYRDRLVPVAFAEAAVRRHPGWSYRFLPDVGHAPQLEAPDRWLAAVGRWLEDFRR